MEDFYKRMKVYQIKYKEDVLGIKDMGKWRGRPYSHILPEEEWDLNLWDGIREQAKRYFKEQEITWHRQKHNLLSSQIMCLNLFFPLKLKGQLDMLKPWLSNEFPDVEKVTDLDFEYIGPDNKDYFYEKEGGRGQNRTSSDISITWIDKLGKKNMLLLEFKFTEANFGECSKHGNPDRSRCDSSDKIVAFPKTQCYRAEIGRKYWDLILSGNSPFRKEALTTESYCPFRYDFYQLMRNQLLAHCIQSDSLAGFHRAEFGVIYHGDNSELLRLSHPFDGKRDSLKTWPSLLKVPNSFHIFTIQNFIHAMETILPNDPSGWRKYIKQRYDL